MSIAKNGYQTSGFRAETLNAEVFFSRGNTKELSGSNIASTTTLPCGRAFCCKRAYMVLRSFPGNGTIYCIFCKCGHFQYLKAHNHSKQTKKPKHQHHNQPQNCSYQFTSIKQLHAALLHLLRRETSPLSLRAQVSHPSFPCSTYSYWTIPHQK